MKRYTLLPGLAVGLLALGVASVQAADVSVRGYFRSNGTYVMPHFRSAPDGSFFNNWSTSPNVNPYTGVTGSKRYPSGTAVVAGGGALGALGWGIRRIFRA